MGNNVMRNLGTTFKDYASLTKPRLSSLVVLTTLCGAAVAPQGTEPFGLLDWFFLFVGSCLVVGAANALNCYLERDVDALMERTAGRPLVTGRIAPKSALIFSIALCILALTLLMQNNLKTAALGFLGFLSYVAIYTPMKRKSMGALFTGAVPGAIPPLMGWAAVRNDLELGAWILFGILFFWQLPHFIAISLFRQDEYDRAGLKTVPGTMGSWSARLQMLFFTGVLGFVSLLPYVLGMAGSYYFFATITLSLAFLVPCFMGLLEGSDIRWVRTAFFGSLAYLPAVLGMWVIDQRLHQWIGNYVGN